MRLVRFFVGKRGEKEAAFIFLSFPFPVPIPLEKEKGREKEGKMEEITSNFKVMEKKKTLLRLSTKQGLKLCDFVFNKR